MATYTHLGAGKYTFQVKGINPEGLSSNEAVTSLAIHILPMWWETWWMRLIYALGFFGLIIGGYYLFSLITSYRDLRIKYEKLQIQDKAQEGSSATQEKISMSADELFKSNLQSVLSENSAASAFKVPDLAAAMAMSETQLRRRMDEVLDMTPGKYIIAFRMERAMKLMQARTYRTVKETAFAVGYSNPNTFARHFKKYHGANPSDLW